MKNNYNVNTIQSINNNKIITLKCNYKIITSLFISCLLSIFLPIKSVYCLTLFNEVQQGSLVYGQTDPNDILYKGDHQIPISPDGQFVFGVGQDEQKITLIQKKLLKNKELTFDVTPKKWIEEVVNGLEPKKVTLSNKNQKRVQQENQKIKTARQQSMDTLPLCFIRPVSKNARISSTFGSRRILNGVKKTGHSGTDYALPKGSPVYTPADGIVKLTADDFFFTGKTILIDHGSGVFSSYSHLDEFMVQTGQSVHQGDMIARIGTTGRSTGPHLHFVLSWYDTRVDPESVFEKQMCTK